jgi:hypothetical protein
MLVASLTTISSRQGFLQSVIDSIACQTVKPDKVLIYYSTEAWYLDEGWKTGPIINTSLDVELHKVPNIGSCRKYLFTLERYRGTNTQIVLLDDDRVWSDYVFEALLDCATKHNSVVTTRGWSRYNLIKNRKGEEILNNLAIEANEIQQPQEVVIANSGWATLFSACDVNDRLFDAQLRNEYMLMYSDEVFLSAMLQKKKYVVPLPDGFYFDVNNQNCQWLSPKTAEAKLKQLELVKL